MKTKDDGGPAFPSPGYSVLGMTLRDYFAAKAMAVIMDWDSTDNDSVDDVAALAYMQADAMLEARAK